MDGEDYGKPEAPGAPDGGRGPGVASNRSIVAREGRRCEFRDRKPSFLSSSRYYTCERRHPRPRPRARSRDSVPPVPLAMLPMVPELTTSVYAFGLSYECPLLRTLGPACSPERALQGSNLFRLRTAARLQWSTRDDPSSCASDGGIAPPLHGRASLLHAVFQVTNLRRLLHTVSAGTAGVGSRTSLGPESPG